MAYSNYPIMESVSKDKLKEIVGDKNLLISEVGGEEEMQKKHMAFESIWELTRAAKELYCGGEYREDKKTLEWDEMVKYLSEAIKKLEGEEESLMEEESEEEKDGVKEDY